MTKGAWAELNGKQQWDVMVAMRGPDTNHSELIKWVSTSVIRWAMHSVMRVGGTLNEDLKLIIVPTDPHSLDRDSQAKVGGVVGAWNSAHFFQHVIEAAYVLGITVCPIPNEVYLAGLANHHQAHMLIGIYKWMKDQSSYKKSTEEVKRHLKDQFGFDTERMVGE